MFFEDHYTGGVEFHVQDTVDLLQKDYNCFVVYVWGGMLIVAKYEGEKVTKFAFPAPSANKKFELENPEIKNLLEKVCEQFEIDLIHVHHTGYIGFDIFTVADELKIPVTYTLHDYYVVHPDFNLLYKFDGKVYHEDKELTDKELNHFTKGEVNNLEQWRSVTKKALAIAEQLTVPSKTVFNEIVKVFPEVESKMKVIPLGLPNSNSQPASSADRFPISNSSSQQLAASSSVCFYGTTYYPNKGRFIALELIPQLLNAEITIHFLGSEPSNWEDLEVDGVDKETFIQFHGKYDRTNGVEKLKAINPTCTIFLPICKETFGFTLSESWMANIPAITTPIGAYKDRIDEHGGGIVLKDFDAENIAKEIISFLKDEKLQHDKRKEIDKINNLWIEETVKEYEKIYNDMRHETSDIGKKSRNREVEKSKNNVSTFDSRFSILNLDLGKESYILLKHQYHREVALKQELEKAHKTIQQKDAETAEHMRNWSRERQEFHDHIKKLETFQKQASGIGGSAKNFIRSLVRKITG